MTDGRLKQIRESEKQSHIEVYSNSGLYKEGSWLRKPIKTVLEIIPHFTDASRLNVLDLGCGVGRNCITIAQSFKNIPCKIDCVDILELAIRKLYDNAEELGVASCINGIVAPIENYTIKENEYDLIIAVSALEHIDSEESFLTKLSEIKNGIRNNGIVCLVINSDITENEKTTGKEIPAQFEVNLPTKKLQTILENTFSGFEIIKTTVSEQQYDIPRGDIVSNLKTKVVTFVAKNRCCV